ncbi:MAG: molybdopterin oxidoreductase family protein [Alphaproteobacteria bacterium]|nr:molybdopterin oxidoreductase family protein [Alphaproteobacteria bacterium]
MPDDIRSDEKYENVDLSPPVSDEVKTTTCYMCACRCGIKVHLKDGAIRYIEGNKEHPVNKGVLCAKGSAGIMQHHSPAKLAQPLRRVGPRGSGEFEPISWDEALATATQWLSEVRYTDPRKLAFFTGRDQSQSLTGFWATQFGTPNHAAHGGFCSVNMAAAGIYTIGGSFWEFGEPDWEHTRYFLMFGVAEDHDSNPIKAGLGKLKTAGKAKFVSVNPVRTGYSAIADEWVGIRPGTDGLFVMALIHELLRTGQVDLEYLARYTNAHWLVRHAPGTADHGLFVRGRGGLPLAYDRKTGQLLDAGRTDIDPAMRGRFSLHESAPGDGGDNAEAVPAFELMLERYLDPRYSPDAVAARTGIEADTIRRIAAELAHAAFEQEITLDQPWTDWAGRRHETMTGRPVSMHAMRGISAHSNGFQTCRAIHLLQMLLGSIDCPGGFRYKPPFPRPAPPGPKPGGKAHQVKAGSPMGGPPLGFVTGPDDLLVDEAGTALRIDKAYSWDAPVAAHGLMHTVIRNAWAGDPYPIEVLFMFMANMSWNSSMNTSETIEMLTDTDPQTGEYRIPKIIYSDAYQSEMVAYADLILPDTTYLERWDCISLLDRPISDADGPADAIRQPVVAPDRDVRPFQDVLIDLGVRLGLPAFCDEDGNPRYPGGYPDYLANHERAPGIGPLSGWRGEEQDSHGRGKPNPDQLARYIENGCFWKGEFTPEQRYYKHANRAYLDHAEQMGWIASADQIVLQLYSEPMQRFKLAGQGFGSVLPPVRYRDRIAECFDPLPVWYAPFEDDHTDPAAFPIHALTQRPMAMYHSWGSQNAWLRQIHGWNKLYMNRKAGEGHGLADGDKVRIESPYGSVNAVVALMEGCNPDTVWTWNAIGKRRGAWNLSKDAPESNKGFLLNHLITDLLPPRDGYRFANADPITGQAAWFDLRVRVVKDDDAVLGDGNRKALPRVPGVGRAKRQSRYGAQFLPKGSWRRKRGGRGA